MTSTAYLVALKKIRRDLGTGHGACGLGAVASICRKVLAKSRGILIDWCVTGTYFATSKVYNIAFFDTCVSLKRKALVVRPAIGKHGTEAV